MVSRIEETRPARYTALRVTDSSKGCSPYTVSYYSCNRIAMILYTRLGETLLGRVINSKSGLEANSPDQYQNSVANYQYKKSTNFNLQRLGQKDNRTKNCDNCNSSRNLRLDIVNAIVLRASS